MEEGMKLSMVLSLSVEYLYTHISNSLITHLLVYNIILRHVAYDNPRTRKSGKLFSFISQTILNF